MAEELVGSVNQMNDHAEIIAWLPKRRRD
jgi:hypothetical protein